MKIIMFLLFMNLTAKQLHLLIHATLYVVEVNKFLVCHVLVFYVGEFSLTSLMSLHLQEKKNSILA